MQEKKTMLYIKGMHCASCEILVKGTFSEFKNITNIQADHYKKEVVVTYTGTLNREGLNKALHEFGYEIGDKKDAEEPYMKRLTDAAVLACLMFIGFYLAQELHLIPQFETNTGAGLTYTSVLILGLIASTSTCMATSGALFLSVIGRSKEKNITKGVLFNLGRVLSYGLFGLIAGFIGLSFSQSPVLSVGLQAVVGAGMILIALDMLNLFSLSSLIPIPFRESLFEKLERNVSSRPYQASFTLGAITYFLPCGFTQSVQLYALGLGNPVQSALLMMVFAIGTIPALMAISSVSAFTKTSWYPYFTKIVAVLLLLVGLSSFNTVVYRAGIKLPTLASAEQPAEVKDQNIVEKDGVQIASMTVNSSGYYPNTFTIKKGVPVRWEIKGENVFGCQGFLVMPGMGIQKTLAAGKNVIEFTPDKEGELGFSCSMGMYRGRFIVVGNT